MQAQIATVSLIRDMIQESLRYHGNNGGQSNTLTVGTATLGYSVHRQMQVYATASVYRFGRLGQAPLSIPSHSSFTNIDSRVADRGNSLGVGVNVTF